MAHQDELEHSLYSTAKNAESLRKKQTQTVEKLNIDLKSLKLQNARKLKVSYITSNELLYTVPVLEAMKYCVYLSCRKQQ